MTTTGGLRPPRTPQVPVAIQPPADPPAVS